MSDNHKYIWQSKVHLSPFLNTFSSLPLALSLRISHRLPFSLPLSHSISPALPPSPLCLANSFPISYWALSLWHPQTIPPTGTLHPAPSLWHPPSGSLLPYLLLISSLQHIFHMSPSLLLHAYLFSLQPSLPSLPLSLPYRHAISLSFLLSSTCYIISVILFLHCLITNSQLLSLETNVACTVFEESNFICGGLHMPSRTKIMIVDDLLLIALEATTRTINWPALCECVCKNAYSDKFKINDSISVQWKKCSFFIILQGWNKQHGQCRIIT